MMSEHSKKMPDIREPIIEVGVRRPRFCTLLLKISKHVFYFKTFLKFENVSLGFIQNFIV